MSSEFDAASSRLNETWPFDYEALIDYLAAQQAEEEFKDGRDAGL